MLDWQRFQELAFDERRIIALTDVGAIIVYGLAFAYKKRENWLFGEDPVTDAQWNEIEEALGRLEDELMFGMVGAILPHAIADLSGIDMLPCDGASYLREDYPLLYDAIDPIYHIDADNFRVPDLRDRFPLAEGSNFALDDSGGEDVHQLTVAEMPSHAHTTIPHTHTEVTAIPAVAQIPLVPIPSAIPAVGITGAAGVTVNAAGGDGSHNNMPPYLAVRWAIVSG